jgi:hypothetical protein
MLNLVGGRMGRYDYQHGNISHFLSRLRTSLRSSLGAPSREQAQAVDSGSAHLPSPSPMAPARSGSSKASVAAASLLYPSSTALKIRDPSPTAAPRSPLPLRGAASPMRGGPSRGEGGPASVSHPGAGLRRPLSGGRLEALAPLGSASMRERSPSFPSPAASRPGSAADTRGASWPSSSRPGGSTAPHEVSDAVVKQSGPSEAMTRSVH